MRKKKYNLKENHEFLGLWWLPEKPDQKIVGILKYDQDDGLALKLEGVLGKGFEDKICTFKVVNGSCYGIDITVFDATDYSGGFNFYEGFIYCNTTLICSDALIGMHLKSQNDLKIKKVNVSFGNLKKWTKMTGVKCVGDFYKNEETKTFTWTEVPSRKFFEDDNIEIKMNFEASATYPQSLNEDFSIKERCVFIFKNCSDLPTFFHNKKCETLRKLLSLCTFTNIEIEYSLFENTEGVICHHIFHRRKISLKFSKPLDDMYYIISFDTFASHSQNLIKNHSSLEELSPEVCGLFYYLKGDILHEKFSITAQALEEFHRDTNVGTERLGFQHRIIKLLEKNDYLLMHIGDKEVISGMVRDHRDYYTHWFDKKRHLVLNGDELLILTLDIYILLVASILCNIGLSKETVLNNLIKNIMFNNHLNYNFNNPSLPITITRKTWK